MPIDVELVIECLVAILLQPVLLAKIVVTDGKPSGKVTKAAERANLAFPAVSRCL
jgi:hypothetical protein